MTKEECIIIMDKNLRNFISRSDLNSFEEEVARNMLNDCKKLLLSSKEKLLKSQLIDVFPSKDLAKRLKKYGKMKTVEDLVNKTKARLLRVRGIGPVKVQMIEEWLRQNDLRFKE